MSSVEINEQELLRDEIYEFKSWEKTSTAQLSKIFKSAAEKLEHTGAFPDTHLIASRMYKIFGKDSERYIRKCLDDKYKRVYEDHADTDAPIDDLEELIRTIEDVCLDMASAFVTLGEKIRETKDPEQRLALRNYIIEKFGTSSELKKRIEEWKYLSVILSQIKQLQDDRQKIDLGMKALIKIRTLFISKNNVGDSLGISSKWVKSVCADKALEDALIKIDKCPECEFPIGAWFKDCLTKLANGLTPEYIPTMFQDSDPE